jgi:hypothetical protein
VRIEAEHREQEEDQISRRGHLKLEHRHAEKIQEDFEIYSDNINSTAE